MRLRWRAGLVVSIALALLVAMAEINRLSASVLDIQGRAWGFTDLMGPAAWTTRQGWLADYPGDLAAQVSRLLLSYLLLDAVLIMTYGLALTFVLHRIWSLPRRRAWLMGAILPAVDLLEGLLALIVSRSGGLGLASLVAIVSTLKWLLVGTGFALLVRKFLLGPGAPGRVPLRHLAKAIRVHRFSLVPVLPLAVLAVVPGSGILDQVPDVQRRWIDDTQGAWHGLMALVGLGLMALAVFWLARARDRLVVRFAEQNGLEQRPEARLGVWLIAPGVAILLAAIVLIRGGDLHLAPLAIFCLVPLVIGAGSWILRRRRQHPSRRLAQLSDPAELSMIIGFGDLVAPIVLVIGGLGAIRSFTALAILPMIDSSYAVRGAAIAMLVAGLLGVIAPWPGLMAVQRLESLPARESVAVMSTRPTGDVRAPREANGGRWLVLSVAVVTLIVWGVAPGFWADRAGVLASIMIILLSLTLIVATCGLIAQESQVPEFLRWSLRLRSTPVLSLLLFSLVLAGLTPAASRMHLIVSSGANSGPDPRPNVAQAFDRWVAQPSPCSRSATLGSGSAAREVDLRPMLLVAAEGGGIRASYWTVSALSQIEGSSSQGCGRGATLLSGGASGGSVGLAVARFSTDPMSEVRKIAAPDALGVGSIGAFDRDLVYGATGIPLSSLGAGRRPPWVDRAGLMENSWGQSSSALAQDFVTGSQQSLPGALVLNSTSVGNACRVWVSQLRFDEPVTGEEQPTEAMSAKPPGPQGAHCDSGAEPAPRTVDLLSTYGPCLGNLTSGTAAMLSARFPYVTPSGVMESCGPWPRDQLVDGGYLENTGIATLLDLSSTWLRLVVAHNAEQLEQTVSKPVIIVPMIVFLDNGTGSDAALANRDITSEALVPPLTKRRVTDAVRSPQLQLSRAASLVNASNICPTSTDCSDLLAQELPRRVIVVYQSSRPSIAAPLGWVLSRASMESMDRAIEEQAASSCVDKNDAVCSRGYGSLGDLLQALGQ